VSGWVAIDIAVAGLGLWLFSHVLELLRPRPQTPTRLRWSDAIPINYVTIGGAKLRYIKAGSGPTIVLLHTLRTKLDLFETVIPELSKHYTVYAFDYPGLTTQPFSSPPSRGSSKRTTCATLRSSVSRSAASFPFSSRRDATRV
jgi:hypothetical protein